MANERRGNRVLSGAYGTLFMDGEPIFEVVNFNADIEWQRGEVQRDGDWDSKITGRSGTWSAEVQQVYSRATQILQEAQREGKDPRFTASVAINDPDAVGGQSERANIGNMWMNNFNLINFTRGEIVSKTYEGGFTPNDSDLAEGIY